MMQDRNGIFFPRRAHASRKSQIEILRDAEKHCGGARQSNREGGCSPTKTFHVHLDFSFLSIPLSAVRRRSPEGGWAEAVGESKIKQRWKEERGAFRLFVTQCVHAINIRVSWMDTDGVSI